MSEQNRQDRRKDRQGKSASHSIRHPIRAVLGLLLLVTGGLSLAFIAVNLAQDLSIWLLGQRVTGHVVDQWLERTNADEANAQELTFRYFVQYEFTTSSGQTISRTTSVGLNEWADLAPGSPVRIRYFPLYPKHSRLDDATFIPIVTCAYLPLAFVCWACLAGGRHLLRSGLSGPRQPAVVSGPHQV